MSLLKIATVETATGEVKEIFNEIQSAFGMVPNGIRLWSMNPERLKMAWDNIKELHSKDEDTQKLHTIIRYLISEAEDCKYCIGFNGNMLINIYGMSQDSLLEMSKNPSMAPLGNKNKALLLFALKAAENSDAVNIEDINALKELNISEKEMYDIVYYASQMHVVDTLFKTFKVQADA